MGTPDERNSLRYDEGGATPRPASERPGEPASSVRAEPSSAVDASEAQPPAAPAAASDTADRAGTEGAAAPFGATEVPAAGEGTKPSAGDTAADGAVTDHDEQDAERRTGRRLNLWVPVAVVAVLVVLAAAFAGTLFLQQRRSQQTETARDEGLTSSRAAARVLFSYDYRSLDKDFQAGLALTAGGFRNEYMRTTSTVVQPVAVQYKAVVRAEVVVAGVVSAKPHEATTIVFLNQTTTSTRVTGTKVDQSRVRMTLREIGGQWKVTAVTAL